MLYVLESFTIYHIRYTRYENGDGRNCPEVFLDKKVYYNSIKNVSEQNKQGRGEIKEAVIDAGSLEVPYLGRYLRILGTVVTISPLLGLLGTVRGMIRAFNVVAVQGVGEPGALAAGISEALYTTAFGLGIAIPALVFYNYFTHRTDRLVRKLESSSVMINADKLVRHGKVVETMDLAKQAGADRVGILTSYIKVVK